MGIADEALGAVTPLAAAAPRRAIEDRRPAVAVWRLVVGERWPAQDGMASNAAAALEMAALGVAALAEVDSPEATSGAAVLPAVEGAGAASGGAVSVAVMAAAECNDSPVIAASIRAALVADSALIDIVAAVPCNAAEDTVAVQWEEGLVTVIVRLDAAPS